MTKRSNRLKFAALAVPSGAVLIGLYVMHSVWLAILLYHIGIGFFVARAREGNPTKKLLSGVNYPALAVSVAICALVGPLIYLLWDHVSLGYINLRTSLTSYGLHGRSWVLFIIYFVSVHPVLEEIYWRGQDYGQNTHVKGLSLGDLAFAGYHVLVLLRFVRLPWAILSFPILSGAAWGWRQQAHKFRGLAVPLLSHIAADCSIIFTTNILVQR